MRRGSVLSARFSQFYWDQLRAPRRLLRAQCRSRLEHTDAPETIIAFIPVAQNRPLPVFSGPDQERHQDSGQRPAGRTATAGDHPGPAISAWKRWAIHQPIAGTGCHRCLSGIGTGPRRAGPPILWKRHDVGAATPLKLTSGVHVVPEVLPFADGSRFPRRCGHCLRVEVVG